MHRLEIDAILRATSFFYVPGTTQTNGELYLLKVAGE